MSFKRFLLGAVLVAASFIPGLNIGLYGAMTVSGIIFSAGVSIAAGGVLSAFVDPLEERQRSARDNPVSPTTPLYVVYGQQRVGVAWTDLRADPSNDDVLYAVGAVCVGSEAGGGVEDITEIWFDNERAVNNPTTDGTFGTTNLLAKYASHVEYSVHLGTDAQAVDAELTSIFSTQWPSTSKGAGIAYIVLRMRYDPDRFPAFPNVTVTVQGQKVYDPRTTGTAYSTNPALCILDYLTSTKYGCGVPLASVDAQSFEDMADYCDEVVNTTAYNDVRFTCTGLVNTNDARSDVLEQLLSSCRGQIIYQGGTYRLYINQPETATTFELTEDNTVGDWEFSRLGNVPNSITPSYIDATEFQAREISWPEAGQANGFLTADNDYPVHATMQLPFTSNVYIAQQIGMVALREHREDIVVSLTAHEEALKLQVGDVVPLTHSSAGFVQKLFRVQTVVVMPNCTVGLLLKEYDAAAYTLDTQNTQDTGTDTNLPDPLVCQPPSGLTLTAGAGTEQVVGGVRLSRIFVEWTASPDAFLSHYEIRHRPTAETEWVQEPDVPRDLTEAYTIPVDDSVEHTVEVRAVNTLGVHSVWVSDTTTPAAIFYPARVIGYSFRYVGDRLWLAVAGNDHTREVGECIIGKAATFLSSDPTLADHQFSLDDASAGEIDTGIDVANPGAGISQIVRVRLAAVNGAGTVGPVTSYFANREGFASSGSATVDTLTAAYTDPGTSCVDPAQATVTYAVTKGGTDTVTIQRWVDGALEATILNASTTGSDTIVDDQEFYEDPPAVTPTHTVEYLCIVKTSGGTVITSAWTGTVDFTGVVDCP